LLASPSSLTLARRSAPVRMSSIRSWLCLSNRLGWPWRRSCWAGTQKRGKSKGWEMPPGSGAPQ
jgi:hypothetical protein